MAAINDVETMAKSMQAHFHTVAQSTSSFEQDFTRVSQRLIRYIAEPLVAQMGLNGGISKPIALFDNACGAGVVTQEVQAALPDEILQSSSFTCADSSAAMVDLVKKRIVNEKWVNVEAKVLDAMVGALLICIIYGPLYMVDETAANVHYFPQNSGLPENSFSHVAIALALHITPDPDAVVKDCIRLLKPGGTFGASTWPKSNSNMFWIPDMRSALQSLPFDAPFPDPMPMQMHHSGHWDDAAWVEKHLRELGLANVSVKESLGTYKFESATEFMTSFGMMLPWVMNTFWSEEVRNAHPAEEVKELLKQHFEDKYNGQGWSVEWLVITMTATVNK
ncbi:hypothetical protein TARUN_4902 [Trichoderma arundinaceum]|uniref:Methyltransferase type 11 domain-containing protein n=1 Tax=Trichoderma arundinaceum TaxID=490622 RepID=A0A395NMP8_TRIAR|nr:hypothetical protein TARUN_4902 [Trichoderma arundinaceum]